MEMISNMAYLSNDDKFLFLRLTTEVDRMRLLKQRLLVLNRDRFIGIVIRKISGSEEKVLKTIEKFFMMFMFTDFNEAIKAYLSLYASYVLIRDKELVLNHRVHASIIKNHDLYVALKIDKLRLF